jgi:hypothetical protein
MQCERLGLDRVGMEGERKGIRPGITPKGKTTDRARPTIGRSGRTCISAGQGSSSGQARLHLRAPLGQPGPRIFRPPHTLTLLFLDPIFPTALRSHHNPLSALSLLLGPCMQKTGHYQGGQNANYPFIRTTVFVTTLDSVTIDPPALELIRLGLPREKNHETGSLGCSLGTRNVFLFREYF